MNFLAEIVPLFWLLLGMIVGFFMKYVTQPQKNALIVHFQNFGVQKFLETLKMSPYTGTLKKR